MAEDGLLGKKLTIALVDEDGNQVGTQSPEILKFSVKAVSYTHLWRKRSRLLRMTLT